LEHGIVIDTSIIVMKRASAAIAALALAALAAFVVMPGFNEATKHAVSESLLGLKARIEGLVGLSLSFDSLSPSIVRSASFSGLTISAPGGRTILSARHVRVTYDLLAILRGEKSEVIAGLELSDVQIMLKLPEDEALLSRITNLLSGGAGVPVPRLVISGRNVAVGLSVLGKGSASMSARTIEFSTLEDEPVVSVEGRFSLSPVGFAEISGPLNLSGSLSRDFSKARLDLALAADSREFSLSTQRFELVYGDGRLSLTKVKDRAPLDAVALIDFGAGSSSISLYLDGYVPSRSLRLSGRYASLMPWLDMPYSGSLLLRAPGTDVSRISYEVKLSGYLPARLFGRGQTPARAELALHGDRYVAEVEKAEVERGRDRIGYSGSLRFADLAPDGVVDIHLSLLDGALDAVAAQVRLVGQNGEYAAMADKVELDGVVFKDFSLSAMRKGSQADFNLSFRPPESTDPAPDLPSARFSGEAGTSSGLPLLRCEGNVSFGGGAPNLELSLDLEAIDLGPCRSLLAALIDSPEAASLLAGLKLGGSLFATSDFKRLSWSATDLTVVSRSLPGTYALLSLSGTATSLTVKRALVSAWGYSVEGSGEVDFPEEGKVDFEAKLALKDIPYTLKGSISGQSLTITGDYDLKLSARASGADTYVSAAVRSLPLPVGGGLFLATLDSNGRFATMKDWALSVAKLELVPTGERFESLPKVELEGDFGPSAADISSLRVEDRYSALSGKAKLAYSLSNPFSAQLSVDMSAVNGPQAEGGTESYKMDISYSGDRLAGNADFLASPLARLGKLPFEGSVDGHATLSGTLSEPSVGFSLKLRDGRYLDQSLIVAGSGSYGGKILELHDVSAAYQGQSISGGSAQFSFADASASLSTVFAGNIGGERFTCSIAATGSSTKSGDGKIDEMLRSYEAEGTLKGLSFGSVSVDSWPFSIHADATTLTIIGGPVKELSLRYSTGGQFSASLQKPLPVVAEVSGLFDGRNIDLSVRGIAFDLSLFSPLIPPDIVKIESGRASGGFHAMGLASDPDLTGEIDLEGLEVRVPGWLSDPVGPFKASIVSTGRKVSVQVPSAPVGKGAVALACQATFDHWLPSGLTASARSLGHTTVRLDSTIVGIRATGDATADVSFALQGDIVAINADVGIERGTIIVNPDILTSTQPDTSRPDIYIAVESNVHFGRGVEVFYPSTSFPIVSGYSDPSSSLYIRYDQSTEDFSMKGTVVLRGGEVFYIERNFFLKNGMLVFNETGDRFDPHVTALAELRDRNDDGPVLITLKADNVPLSSFKPSLSSDPPMTEAQIAAMMGQNLLGASAENSFDVRKASINLGSEFIPFTVTRTFENKMRQIMGLDMFYARSQFLQNWLVDISEQSQVTPSNALGRYFDQTELYAGKYLTDSIFAHATLSLSKDPLVDSNTLILNSELGMDLEFGVDLDTPFGLVQWSVTPVTPELENLLISDQSLSLTWKLSY
jgi:hypothetical protein